jgi:hypothetical protein
VHHSHSILRLKVINNKFAYFSILVGISFTVLTSNAAKLFAADVVYGDLLNPSNILVEDESLPHLLDDLFTRSGSFSVLQGEDFSTVSLRYFAIPEALTLKYAELPDGTFRVNLSSSLTALDQTFSASSEADLADQIIDWFFLEGGDEALDFLRELSIASTMAITDGNPGSTTAKMADSAFELFGFYHRGARTNDMRGTSGGSFVGLSVKVDTFDISSLVGELDANLLQVSVPLWLHFSRRVSYAGQMNANVISIEGTDFYGFGLDAGIAVRPILRTGKDRFGWQITPFVGGNAMASADGVTASFVYHFGLNNRFEVRLFKNTLLSIVSQYGPYENLALDLAKYNLNAKVDQQILKNGLRLEVPLFFKSLDGNVSLVDTRFLEDAYGNNYQTFGAGLGYHLKHLSIHANIGFNYMDDYKGAKYDFACSWDL